MLSQVPCPIHIPAHAHASASVGLYKNCKKFGQAGGCLLVTAAMDTFPEDRNLQHVGCAAVANLAIGNAENTRRLVKAGARLAVQRAMDKFIGVRAEA